MPNFLEQLVAEWYEFRGYFVRRNVKVGPRAKGGYESELDVVAFHPSQRQLVHIEPSMDSDSWSEREKRFTAKFAAGKQYVPNLFAGLPDLPEVQQIALLVYAGQGTHPIIGGAKVVLIGTLMREIRTELANRPVASKAVPEQFQILRALQFAANYWSSPAGARAG